VQPVAATLAATATARPNFLIVSSFLNTPPAFGQKSELTGVSFPHRSCIVHVRDACRGGRWSFRDAALQDGKKGIVMRDRLPEQEANIALLIDADNASPEHLDEVLLVLGELGTINIRRAYGNWSKASLKGWGAQTGPHSIIPMQQFDVVKGKSATDMRMTIDAMDLLYRGNVDGFGIMSSDSDFLPLAQRIREDGLPVYGFGTAKTPVSFQQACTRFFDVSALAMTQEDELEQPKATAGTRPVDTELLQVLGAAYKASKRDEEGYTPLSELGQRAKAVSSFAARNFGYTRLSELIRAVPNFEVKAGDDGRLLVKRLR
jgi:uncharacterized protein (TIGR00288 family)